MNTFITVNVPASLITTAIKITDALGNGHPGMFRAAMTAAEGETESLGFISTGMIQDTSPLINGRQAMLDALVDTDVTEQEIDDLLAVMDLTDEKPRARVKQLQEEVSKTTSAADWARPFGSTDTYGRDAVTKHRGKTWVSMQNDNPFEPGVASWREIWSAGPNTPPAWVQPSGSTDFYGIGERVTYLGDVWVSTLAVNVWAPGVTGWEKLPTNRR